MSQLVDHLLAAHLAATTPPLTQRGDRSWLFSTTVFLLVAGVMLWRGCR